MAKLRIAGSRLSIGSWSIPFARSTNKTEDAEKKSRRYSAIPTPVKEIEPEASPSPPPTLQKPVVNDVAKPSTSSLIELAQVITRETKKLDRYLKDNGIQAPSFEVDSQANFPKLEGEIKRAREEIVRATRELGDLVTGPTESIRWMAWDHNNSLSLHAIYHYKIAKSFPINETATFAQIAEKVGLDELNVCRFLRHAMTNRIFKEVSKGVVAHTAASRVLAENSMMNDWVGFCTDDIWPAASRTIAALELNPSASEPTQTGFCFANNTTDIEPMFATFGKDPVRAKRMGGAMVSLTGGEGYEVSHLIDNYAWSAIDDVSGTVVDVGGSHGFVCIDLAKRFKNIRFVVQDLPKTIASVPKPLEGDIGEWITFMAHDFYTPQPIKGADVYLFRWILHNQADKYAIKMLRQLIPALKRGARVVINDHCLPEPGTESVWDEKIIRTMDLVMLTLLNAQERSEEEFRALFERVDRRFVFRGAKRVEGCRMSVVEAVWEGEDFDGNVEGDGEKPRNVEEEKGED